MENLDNIVARGISLVWHVEDVQTMLDDRGHDVVLTTEQLAMVLHHVKRRHDANEGVTWDTLEHAAEALGFIKF